MDLTVLLPNENEFAFWEDETIYTKTLYVDCNAKRNNSEGDGSLDHPFRSINEAASIAEPGTKIRIHGGVYRECVRPVRGGNGPKEMICYEAYGDGEVIIKASVVVNKFEPSTGWRMGHGFQKPDPSFHIFQTKLNPEEFQGYNPFCAVNILHDRLFIEYDKTDMSTYLNRRGMVFCDGKPLHQVALYGDMTKKEGSYWVEANGQTVHFRLWNDDEPVKHTIELTCREQCFAPEIPFLSYIKVKGITCAHAATGAPVPQRGALSCYRGHHWLIENCTIDWSNCVGIDIGNECWHHEMIEGQQIGYSIIRGCKILDVGVCGIAALFAGHCLIEDNLIEGTGWQRMELSWEAGGIKIHNSIDTLIRRNIFTRTYGADHLWLDCGNENNRITQNLFLDGIEQREAIFIECTRDGINLIDNNIFWNVQGRFDESKVPKEPGSSGWYKTREHDVVNGYAIYGEGTDHLRIVNNLIGNCRSAGYFSKPVAFRMSGMLRGGTSLDAHIYNNIFYDCGEAAIKFPTEKNKADGNLYVKLSGGYLRVIYPEPEVCLDLPAWREFFGFDEHGQEGWFNIKVDTRNYTMSFESAKEKPLYFGSEGKGHTFLYDVSKVKKIKQYSIAVTDFYGIPCEGEHRLPGPLPILNMDTVYGIDPRREHKS